MITKISLKKVASYGENPAILETDKRINLIYGLNGSGKTTLSNILANRNNPDFSNCSIDGIGDEKILVYNRNFIQTNFYEKDQLNGIFTLSSTNKEAEEKIKDAENKIREIDEALGREEKKQAEENKKLEQLKEASEKKTWDIKTKYSGGDRVLEFCLEGLRGNKSALFGHLLKTKKLVDKPEKTIEDIKKEAEETQGSNAIKYNESEIQKIRFDFSIIENNSIFSEVIVGNENATISSLIKKLHNADWVKQGFCYLSDSTEVNTQCPFCQQETITQDLYNQIKDYFDVTYQERIEEIVKMKNQYDDGIKTIPIQEDLLKNTFIKAKEKDFKTIYLNLLTKLNNNLEKITLKKDKASQVLSLELTQDEIISFNNFLDEIIKEIKSHNLKIDNKTKTKEEIINTFWQIMRWEYDQVIEFYNVQKISIDNTLEAAITAITEMRTKRNEQIKIIEEAQKEVVNIDKAIQNINDGLKDLGAEGFNIEKIGERFYKIERKGQGNNQFKTLSEGEKTIISFLYFLELCKGKENENEVSANKIVVIDDPISSLSHIYIFNISQLIKLHFFSNPTFQQVFVLTHSLYFFHELLLGRGNNKEKQLFRIIKSSNGSCIFPMNKDEIQNDYQAYWQILKDHEQGKASDALLANSMRNILEHFFGFIEREKYDESIQNIDQQRYQAFIRYINRESHSDFVNISDTKEIDCILFKEAFKEIFDKSGYENHYNRMMNNYIQDV